MSILDYRCYYCPVESKSSSRILEHQISNHKSQLFSLRIKSFDPPMSTCSFAVFINYCWMVIFISGYSRCPTTLFCGVLVHPGSASLINRIEPSIPIIELPTNLHNTKHIRYPKYSMYVSGNTKRLLHLFSH